MVLGGEERTDVAVEDEVRLDPALDRLDDLRIRLVDEVTNLAKDVLLPSRAADRCRRRRAGP
jgi:hypothetical protein